jgi:DNA-binding NarL/FixJ family response regulator
MSAEKILRVGIIEDNEVIRQGLVELFNKKEFYSCINAYDNAEDAIGDKSIGQCDVLLMDINLPGMTGIEAIQRLKNEYPKLLFMILTVYDEDEKVFSALKSGASGYLLKSSSPELILTSVRELANGGSPMSALIARKVVNAFHAKTENVKGIESLSKRENEVLDLLSRGLTYRELAEKLFISVGTVKQHANNIYEKLHVSNRTQAINKMNGK